MRRVEKIETAVEPRFQEHFVGGMGIPHANDPYPAPGAGGRPARSANLRRGSPIVLGGAARRRTHLRGAPHERRGTAATPWRRARGATGRPTPRGRREDPVHHPHVDAVRGPERRGRRASIEQNADTILEQVGIEVHGAPDALRAVRGGGRRRRGGVGAVPGRHVPADRAGDRAAGVHAVRAEPRATTC